MARYGYSAKMDGENMAKAVGRALPISTKQSIEICSFIRSMKVQKAKSSLDSISRMEHALPMKRFNGDTGHKHGIYKGPGRYPKKAINAIKKIVLSAESNALFKGLSADNLIISHISAKKAAGQMHYGRHQGREMKRTNVEVVLEEKKEQAKEKKPEVGKKEPGKAVKSMPKPEEKPKLVKEEKSAVRQDKEMVAVKTEEVKKNDRA